MKCPSHNSHKIAPSAQCLTDTAGSGSAISEGGRSRRQVDCLELGGHRHNKCRIFHLETLHLAGDEGERIVLADNKCKCVRVTSRIIPSPENPNEDILERHIRIIIPVNSRENISDPTSPVRTKFVYHLSDLCKKCDPVEVELDNQVVTASQSNICDEESETCYAYDRNKCYTNRVPLTYGGQTKIVETALTPDSCYPD
uniref:Joining chain of multimeric IgA and IgM n=1 Tax=Equus caballus TaxID=9796 RepID=A0A9L0RND0_HORSE